MGAMVEINCTNCRQEAFLKREPVYQGFKKVAEELSCSACGFVFASEEEVPFKTPAAAQQIFTEADRPKNVKIFTEGENRCTCRYCANYVINPFVQFCSLHKKEVQATDSCPRFAPSAEKSSEPLKGL